MIIESILPDNDAMLQPFTRPILGFEIDKRLLKKYGKWFFKVTETRLKLKMARQKRLKTTLELKKRKESREHQ